MTPHRGPGRVTLEPAGWPVRWLLAVPAPRPRPFRLRAAPLAAAPVLPGAGRWLSAGSRSGHEDRPGRDSLSRVAAEPRGPRRDLDEPAAPWKCGAHYHTPGAGRAVRPSGAEWFRHGRQSDG